MPKWVLSHLSGGCWSLSTQLSRDRQAHISAQRPVPSSPLYLAPCGASQWCGAVVGTLASLHLLRSPSTTCPVCQGLSEGTNGCPQLTVVTKSPALNGVSLQPLFNSDLSPRAASERHPQTVLLLFLHASGAPGSVILVRQL